MNNEISNNWQDIDEFVTHPFSLQFSGHRLATVFGWLVLYLILLYIIRYSWRRPVLTKIKWIIPFFLTNKQLMIGCSWRAELISCPTNLCFKFYSKLCNKIMYMYAENEIHSIMFWRKRRFLKRKCQKMYSKYIKSFNLQQLNRFQIYQKRIS